MSKNVVISEDGTAKTFMDVNKISVQDLEGSDTFWVPEDEAQNYVSTATKSIGRNGNFKAADDNVFAFTEVSVNVPQGGGGGGLIAEHVLTDISACALIPKVSYNENDGWEWDSGHGLKTFVGSVKTAREYIEIAEASAELKHENFITPSNFANIQESETTLFSVGGKQLYFASLSNLTAANLTTVSPRVLDPEMSTYEEDMCKCRRLRTSGTAKSLAELSASTSSSGGTLLGDISFNMLNGAAEVKLSDTSTERTFSTLMSMNSSQYGDIYSYDKTLNSAGFFTKFKGTSYPRPLFKFEEGVAYYSFDGEVWAVLNSNLTGGTVRIIDHAPTASDVLGVSGAILQVDLASTPIASNDKGKIYAVSNVYAEISDDITINVDDITIGAGGEYQFTSNYDDAIWSVDTPHATIDDTGLLTVSDDFTDDITATVTATNPRDTSNFSTSKVTLKAPGTPQEGSRDEMKEYFYSLWLDYYNLPSGAHCDAVNYGQGVNYGTQFTFYGNSQTGGFYYVFDAGSVIFVTNTGTWGNAGSLPDGSYVLGRFDIYVDTSRA